MTSNGWFVVVSVLYVLLILLTRPGIRRPLVRVLDGPTRRLLDRLTAPPPVDPEAAELYRLARLERLAADLHRVAQLVATDEHRSATRQLANRLAYDILRAEVGRYPRQPSSIGRPLSQLGPRPAAAPTVEVLEIGWRPAR